VQEGAKSSTSKSICKVAYCAVVVQFKKKNIFAFFSYAMTSLGFVMKLCRPTFESPVNQGWPNSAHKGVT